MPDIETENLDYLYGEDPTERIVGVHPVFDDGATYMRCYFRSESGEVHHEDDRFYPFFYLDDIGVLEPYDRDRFKFKKLKGTNRYNYLIVSPEWNEHKDIKRFIYNRYGYPEPKRDEDGEKDYDFRQVDEMYSPGNMTTQYLMQSGRTLFKGMQFRDVRRMQLDIETYTEREFPNAERDEDKITIVSMSDSTGWECLIYLNDDKAIGAGISESKAKRISGANQCWAADNEAHLLELTRMAIKDRDPDVIEGHNCFKFDLSYIMTRADKLGVFFGIGRNGDEPYTFETERKFAERQVEYPMFSIGGRSVIDTWFSVMDYDVFARDMPGHGLKESAKYFGVEGGDGSAEDRTYVEGSEIPRIWLEEPERLLKYALDDVRETGALSEQLSTSTFYLTQLLPFTFGGAERYGTATIIEGLMSREYLRQRQSIPEPDDGEQTMGGYTDIFWRGVFDRLVYADVSSLYPAIMLNYDCNPGEEKDPIHMFKRSLDKLTDMRLEVKDEMNEKKTRVKKLKEKTKEETENPNMPPTGDKAKIKKLQAQIDELDARQSSYKILINSFYGAMGFLMFAWNNFEEADRVAETGQKLLKQMIGKIEEDGGTVIEVDTDGVIFTPNDPETGEDQMGIERTDEAEAEYVRSLTEYMPEGIEIDHDGSFKRMVSYKKKNYALMDYDGKIKIKGSSLISRAYEPFGREYVRRMIDLLMERDIQGMHDLYNEFYSRIYNSEWDVGEFAARETLKDSFEQYERDVEKGHGNGGHYRFARYEVAKKDAEKHGTDYRVGDRVSFYVARNGRSLRKTKVSRAAKHVRDYDNDEHREYYLKDRFPKFVKKFAPLFTEHEFNEVFDRDDGLFPFDADGIEIKNTRLQMPLELA